MSLWCRLKHIGSSSATADAGYFISHPLDWLVADLLMPELSEELLSYGNEETEYGIPATHLEYQPARYGSSIIPLEREMCPEKCLTLKLASPSTALFKSLGFVEPNAVVLRMLRSCEASECSISVDMGSQSPSHLTRLSLRLSEPKFMVEEELALCLNFTYDAGILAMAMDAFGVDAANVVEYAAELKGFTV